MTEMNCAGSFHPQDDADVKGAPSAHGGGIEERIAATGRRIAALQHQLDGAMAELGQARRRTSRPRARNPEPRRGRRGLASGATGT